MFESPASVISWSQWIFLLSGICLASSCGPDLPEVPDVSGINVDIEVRRFDRDLIQLDTSAIDSSLAQLEAQYPNFAPLFFKAMLPIRRGDLSPEEQAYVLKSFIGFSGVQQLFATTDSRYPSLETETQDLEQALRFFTYYFPNVPLPTTLTTFVSEYQYGALIYGENELAAGLDLFLGPNYGYRQIDPANPIFSQYLNRTYTREHLVSKLMQTLIGDVVGEVQGQRMVDYMIHNGKQLYLLDLVLPYTPDSIKAEVTAEQAEWLEANEFNMWAFFLEKDLFYSTNYKDFRKYINPSPNSPEMPPEAPGRTANWLGWQVVKRYMQQHPEVTPQELVALRDAQLLLEQSRYKPRR